MKIHAFRLITPLFVICCRVIEMRGRLSFKLLYRRSMLISFETGGFILFRRFQQMMMAASMMG